MWGEGGQDKKEGDRETGGGRPKKISVRMDAERTGRKTRKNLEKRSEQGLQEKGERMKGGKIGYMKGEKKLVSMEEGAEGGNAGERRVIKKTQGAKSMKGV